MLYSNLCGREGVELDTFALRIYRTSPVPDLSSFTARRRGVGFAKGSLFAFLAGRIRTQYQPASRTAGLTELAGSHSGMFSQPPAEISGLAEAAHPAHIGDFLVGVPQKGSCFL